MFKEQLQQLGLTGGEAKTYEALLRIGESTVGPIVKESGVAYSNIYGVLNRLAEKGLVSFVLREKTKYLRRQSRPVLRTTLIGRIQIFKTAGSRWNQYCRS